MKSYSQQKQIAFVCIVRIYFIFGSTTPSSAELRKQVFVHNEEEQSVCVRESLRKSLSVAYE